jgi:hypothetical protein
VYRREHAITVPPCLVYATCTASVYHRAGQFTFVQAREWRVHDCSPRDSCKWGHLHDRKQFNANTAGRRHTLTQLALRRRVQDDSMSAAVRTRPCALAHDQTAATNVSCAKDKAPSWRLCFSACRRKRLSGPRRSWPRRPGKTGLSRIGSVSGQTTRFVTMPSGGTGVAPSLASRWEARPGARWQLNRRGLLPRAMSLHALACRREVSAAVGRCLRGCKECEPQTGCPGLQEGVCEGISPLRLGAE